MTSSSNMVVRQWRLLVSLALVGLAAPLLSLAAQAETQTLAPSAVPTTVAPPTAAPAADSSALVAAIAQTLAASNSVATVTRTNWQRMQRLYAARGNAAIWVRSDSTVPLLDARAGDLIDAMLQAPLHALRLDVYGWGDLHRALDVARLHRNAPDTLAMLEVRLTAAFLAYGSDMLTGQINPRSVNSSWHIDPQKINVDSLLSATLQAGRLVDALNALHPQNAQYDELQRALVRYRQVVANGDWPKVSLGSVLRPRTLSTAGELSALLARLSMEGYAQGVSLQRPAGGTRPDSSGNRSVSTIGTGDTISTSGTGAVVVYDSTLAGAVAAYQRRHGLVEDSIVGPGTLASLNQSASYRARQIAANMERLRWLPRSFEQRFIVVNLPAFQLHAFDGGQEVLTMKVIVGAEYGGRSTPVFSDSMAYVVFRPYWNVPDGIAARELWPKQQRDPSYFGKNGYEVVRASWGTYVRQKPSPTNALGQVKFIFPNDFAIYLHDTPTRSLFSEDVRAFSHGCIRVEHPDSLALFALGPQGWDLSRVQAAMQSGKNDTRIDLSRKLPVYIVYFTTYAVGDALQFAPDIYDRDAALMGVIAQSDETRDAALVSATDVRALVRALVNAR